VKYAFIKENAEIWPVCAQCRTFNVSRPGYYQWLKRPASSRNQSNAALDEKIKKIFESHKGRYGAPRITQELIDQGENVNQKRVAHRMKALNLKAKQAKKFKVTTDSHHSNPVAPNVLEQNFTAKLPNQKWVQDITYVWTSAGWLYLAVVIDLFNRQVIGWSMSCRINQELVCDALMMALWRRNFPKYVITHSDRGSQYCSKRYQQLLKDNKLMCSMSGRGNCYDNAVAESFFHSLKVECIHGQHFHTREAAQQIIFEYIEIYYNKIRRHSALGYLAPE
jgi:putative transposase